MNKYLDKALRWCVFQMTDSKDHRVCTKETPPITTKTFDEDALDGLTLNIQKSIFEGENETMYICKFTAGQGGGENSTYFHRSKTIGELLEISFW